MSVADEHVVYGGPHGLGWEKLDRSKLCQTELCSTGLKRPPQGAVFCARNERAPGLPPGPLSLSLFGHLAIWPFANLNAALPRYAAISAPPPKFTTASSLAAETSLKRWARMK